MVNTTSQHSGQRRNQISPPHLLGKRGERVAEEFLESAGYRILDRNWRCREGEIDLVSLSPDDRVLVFAEVKTRSSLSGGSPFEAITEKKVRNLRLLASRWCEAHPLSRHADIRIDAIGIVMSVGAPSIDHRHGICQ